MQNQNNNTGNQVMNQSIQRGCRTGFLARSNSFAGGVTGVLLLCLWIMPAVPTVNAAAGGTVVAWGWNAYGQTTVPAGLSGVTAVAASYSDTVALKSDGTVVAWGNNGQGQTTVPAGLSGVTAIAAGAYHTVALKNDGTVVAWGIVGYVYQIPPGLSGVTAIAAGELHTVALKSDGTVVAWGENIFGGTDVPAGLSGVTAIAAGAFHTVALKNDGTVVAWGGDTFFVDLTVPAGLSGVTAIAAGGQHTVVVQSASADTTPPVITCPANVEVILSLGQLSAVVNYPAPVATDDSGSVTVTSSPASGSVFPLGMTTVTATATDPSGNHATCTFSVALLSPQDATRLLVAAVNQLAALGTLSAGNANSLTSKLNNAIARMNAGNATAAANQLQAFINEVNALVRSRRLAAATGAGLIDAARQIIAVLGS